LFVDIHLWKVERAKYVDESTSEVLRSHHIIKIVLNKPSKAVDLRSIFGRVEEQVVELIHPMQRQLQHHSDVLVKDEDDWESLEIHALSVLVHLNEVAAPMFEEPITTENDDEVEIEEKDEPVIIAKSNAPDINERWIPKYPPKSDQPLRLKRPAVDPIKHKRPKVPRTEEARKRQRVRRKFSWRRNQKLKRVTVTINNS